MPSPSTVLVESGPLYALWDRDDAHHRSSVAFLERNQKRTLISNVCVLTEVVFQLQGCGLSAAIDPFLAWSDSALTLDDGTGDDLPRIRTLIADYHDHPADFTDASLVALAERLECFTVASVDHYFTVYRSAFRRRFTNVLTER